MKVALASYMMVYASESLAYMVIVQIHFLNREKDLMLIKRGLQLLTVSSTNTIH
ncbi:unnamed protein product, partial [Sphenostylis stenocarpa]